MISIVFLLPLLWVVYSLYSTYAKLQVHIAAAKASGLPYIVAPVHIYGRFWLITHGIWIPLLAKLPSSWVSPWLEYMDPNWVWTNLYGSFEKRGGDTFMVVSPTKNIIWVATPSIVHQMTTKRESFPKALESYGILDIYGKSLVSLEGKDWKRHRKVTSPSFTEKNNMLVFKESIAQSQAMVRKWNAGSDKTIRSVPADTMRVALHIISMVGFGVRLLWPGETAEEKHKIGGVDYGSSEPPPGHTMSFAHALELLLENLLWVLLMPKWLLPKIPIASARLASEAFQNWSQFMQELFALKKEEARTGQRAEGMDLLGGLVKSSYSPDSKSAEKGQESTGLSDSEILGNAFVMILAGHETTANSIHFSLLLLAMTPSSQRNLQTEVTALYGDTDPSEWDYDKTINQLLGGMVGAVLNEELRLFPPVVAIPKIVHPEIDQAVTANGKTHILPKGTFISLVAVAVHRNPKYWPSKGPSKISGKETDLEDFVPERWLVDKSTAEKKLDVVAESVDGEDLSFGAFNGSSVSTSLFRPVPGSFIPFSDGARSCLGRRLAQVEVVAVLATIFQKYSVELAVDRWASDDEVVKMSDAQKREVYTIALTEARRVLSQECSTRITLKLHGDPDHIPVRIVKKGEERFIGLME